MLSSCTTSRAPVTPFAETRYKKPDEAFSSFSSRASGVDCAAEKSVSVLYVTLAADELLNDV
jgi:hypothetical protein